MIEPVRQLPLKVTVSPTAPTEGETLLIRGRLLSVQLLLALVGELVGLWN